MLRKSRSRALHALFGSAMLVALPLATGCQSANFGGNVPGMGWVQGWWGGDAAKSDPNKPPAGYMPSSKADPNGSSYAGRGRSPRDGYGAEGGGYESKRGSGASYAAGDRSNPSNWGGANRQASGATSGAGYDTEYAGGASGGYGAGASTRGSKSAVGGNDPYGSSAPSNEDDSYAASVRGSAYSADSRNGYSDRGATPYSSKMTSGAQRATTRAQIDEEIDYDAESAPRTNGSGSRFSSESIEGEVAPARNGRSTNSYRADAEDDAMTADEDVEASYPQTTGYKSSYTVPDRGSKAPSTERRYPATKSGASKKLSDDYGMRSEPETTDDDVQVTSAAETGRYGLSAKAANMLDRSGEGEFRPGSTSRPGYTKRASVAQAGYSDEDDSASTAARTSRFGQ